MSCCSPGLPRLAPDGVARLVVGKNLGADTLQRWLIEQGYSCERARLSKRLPGPPGPPPALETSLQPKLPASSYAQ